MMSPLSSLNDWLINAFEPTTFATPAICIPEEYFKIKLEIPPISRWLEPAAIPPNIFSEYLLKYQPELIPFVLIPGTNES